MSNITLNLALKEVYNVFGEIHTASEMSSMLPDTPLDRVLIREVAQQSEKDYNTLDVFGVMLVKASDAHTQMFYNS